MSFSNAISSMFGSAKSHSSSSSSAAARRASNPPAPTAAAAAQSASSPGSLLGGGPTAADSPLSSPSALGAPDSLLTPYGHLSREVGQIELYRVSESAIPGRWRTMYYPMMHILAILI